MWCAVVDGDDGRVDLLAKVDEAKKGILVRRRGVAVVVGSEAALAAQTLARLLAPQLVSFLVDAVRQATQSLVAGSPMQRLR